MVIPLNDTPNSDINPDIVKGKALFIRLTSMISMNRTIESVLFSVFALNMINSQLQQYEAKGLLLAVPVLSDKELQSTRIAINDTVVANKVTF